MRKRKNSKRKSVGYFVHPDSYMYFGHVNNDRVIGDEYFSIDI